MDSPRAKVWSAAVSWDQLCLDQAATFLLQEPTRSAVTYPGSQWTPWVASLCSMGLEYPVLAAMLPSWSRPFYFEQKLGLEGRTGIWIDMMCGEVIESESIWRNLIQHDSDRDNKIWNIILRSRHSESVWMCDQWCCCTLFAFFPIPLLEYVWLMATQFALTWGQQRRWCMQGLSTSAGPSISLNSWGCTNCSMKLLSCLRPFLLTCAILSRFG